MSWSRPHEGAVTHYLKIDAKENCELSSYCNYELSCY